MLRNAVNRPATLLYPFQKIPPADGIKGRLVWEMEKCIGCGICPKICPSQAIRMNGAGSKAEIVYRLDKCLFCGECVDNCPTNAIEQTREYELVYTSPQEMTAHFRRGKQEPSLRRLRKKKK